MGGVRSRCSPPPASSSPSPGLASGHPGHLDGAAEDVARDTQQHGDAPGHLPATKSNVDLVSKLKLKNVVPEKVADVGVFNSAPSFRVVRVSPDDTGEEDRDGYPELAEVGRFIDEGGSNLWGVEVFQSGGKEYVAASDRDFGLYIFRYTGG
ncbi:MAG: hypothetical protein LH461_11620 [Spirochaetaceae bacterium]|nr:hypothetical protein [Spirochaetaceae bacterium]